MGAAAPPPTSRPGGTPPRPGPPSVGGPEGAGLTGGRPRPARQNVVYLNLERDLGLRSHALAPEDRPAAPAAAPAPAASTSAAAAQTEPRAGAAARALREAVRSERRKSAAAARRGAAEQRLWELKLQAAQQEAEQAAVLRHGRELEERLLLSRQEAVRLGTALLETKQRVHAAEGEVAAAVEDFLRREAEHKGAVAQAQAAAGAPGRAGGPPPPSAPPQAAAPRDPVISERWSGSILKKERLIDFEEEEEAGAGPSPEPKLSSSAPPSGRGGGKRGLQRQDSKTLSMKVKVEEEKARLEAIKRSQEEAKQAREAARAKREARRTQEENGNGRAAGPPAGAPNGAGTNPFGAPPKQWAQFGDGGPGEEVSFDQFVRMGGPAPADRPRPGRSQSEPDVQAVNHEERLRELQEEDPGAALEKFFRVGSEEGMAAPSAPSAPAAPAPAALPAEDRAKELQARARATRERKERELDTRIKKRQGERQREQAAKAEEGNLIEAKRREARDSIQTGLHPFMPERHTIKSQLASAANSSKGLPGAGSMCNKYCALLCVQQCTTGFLQANDVPCKHANPTVDQLRASIKTCLRKFHPDRNRPGRVGLEKSLRCEELCKMASLLQNLFEEADALDINVFCQQNAGRYKFRVGLKSTIKELKDRIHEEEPDMPAAAMRLKVSQGFIVLSDDSKTIEDYRLQHNCTLELKVDTTNVPTSWAQFE